MKLIWLTDIHLNFLKQEAREVFYREILGKNPDALLISGDIGEAPSTAVFLKEMAAKFQRAIYFVLGNHDYFFGKINAVRSEMTRLTQSESLLYWLPASGPQVLEPGLVLVGQDGWADGRYGDYSHSRVLRNDNRIIVDLFEQKKIGKDALLEKMHELADQDAEQLKKDIDQVMGLYHPKKILVLTHVPPFKEACLYEDHITHDDSLPYFSSKATGDVLLSMATKNPSVEFLVLCGHTHSEAEYQPLDNLLVRVGGAEFYRPKIQEIVFCQEAQFLHN